jgi:hypothetical protein
MIRDISAIRGAISPWPLVVETVACILASVAIVRHGELGLEVWAVGKFLSRTDLIGRRELYYLRSISFNPLEYSSACIQVKPRRRRTCVIC